MSVDKDMKAVADDENETNCENHDGFAYDNPAAFSDGVLALGRGAS